MKTLYTILAAILCAACTTTGNEPSELRRRMDGAVDALVIMRTDSSGTWDDAGWWNSANITTALLRYGAVTGDTARVMPAIRDLFERAPEQAVDFINDYYDDQGWWILAWIDAYNLTGGEPFLRTARITFQDMTTGWSEECGGGIYWKKPAQYKNAIANNLFSLCAARLYKATGEQEYFQWLDRNISWFLTSGMINPKTGLVDDGTRDRLPTDGRYHTYNQGVAIAALTEMYLITDDRDYLETARSIADAAIAQMVNPDGILMEPYEPALNADAIQFKGIFMRHLGFLYAVTGEGIYGDFITANARSIMDNDYDPATGTFGGLWYGPFDAVHSGATASALECLVEAYAVSGE
ncbi:MAG: glycoside hydrolase family 76 protein [Rikenellaceae bacterium]|nr:glycoside hydrolase family 76 protein [Rikenellaceae bacterium]